VTGVQTCALPIYPVPGPDVPVEVERVADGEPGDVAQRFAGQRAGEPLRDVARFAVGYALYLDRHVRPGHRVPGHRGLRADSWGAGLVHAAHGNGWFGAVVRGYLVAAAERLGLSRDLWSDIMLAGIADVAATADHPDFARDHFELLVRITGGVPR